MESVLQQQSTLGKANSGLKEKYTSYQVNKHADKPIGGVLSNKHRRHVIIMTEVGRPVYVRYGDEMEASSFIATLGAILEKFKIFFSKDGYSSVSKWQKLTVKHKTIYFLYRKHLVYICVNDNKNAKHNAAQELPSVFPMYTNAPQPDESCDFIIQRMLDFLNVQMISIMTDQVNLKLAQRPNYDPQQTLGDRNQLIGTTIKNGLHSPAIILNGFMACPLALSHRKACHSALGEAIRETGCIVAMLTTPNYVVDIFKQKGFEFGVGDILLLQNLLQSQNSLRNSHNWIPMCLPGMSAEGMIYVYITFLVEGGDLALIMISSSNETFFKCKDASQVISNKIQNGSTQGSALSAIGNAITGLPYSHKISSNYHSMILKHFIIQQIETKQISLPDYAPFGKQPIQFKHQLTKYAMHFQKYLSADATLKLEFMQVSRDQQEYSGIYASEEYLIFFTLDKLVALPEINAQLNLLIKWVKLEEQIKFISKFS